MKVHIERSAKEKIKSISIGGRRLKPTPGSNSFSCEKVRLRQVAVADISAGVTFKIPSYHNNVNLTEIHIENGPAVRIAALYSPSATDRNRFVSYGYFMSMMEVGVEGWGKEKFSNVTVRQEKKGNVISLHVTLCKDTGLTTLGQLFADVERFFAECQHELNGMIAGVCQECFELLPGTGVTSTFLLD